MDFFGFEVGSFAESSAEKKNGVAWLWPLSFGKIMSKTQNPTEMDEFHSKTNGLFFGKGSWLWTSSFLVCNYKHWVVRKLHSEISDKRLILLRTGEGNQVLLDDVVQFIVKGLNLAAESWPTFDWWLKSGKLTSWGWYFIRFIPLLTQVFIHPMVVVWDFWTIHKIFDDFPLTKTNKFAGWIRFWIGWINDSGAVWTKKHIFG